MIAGGTLLWLLAQAATAPAAPAPETAPASAPAPVTVAPAPPPPPRTAPPPRAPVPVVSPFRLSLTYVHVLREDGELANPSSSTNAIGIDMAFPSNSYVRNHLGLANQWETVAGVAARGFRIDLVSLGYPIPLVTTPSGFHLDLEPILTVLRGELMFVTNGPRFLRVESGFSLELSATLRHWFVMVQAFGIDFRYWVYGSNASVTGFSRVFPLQFAIGHEF